MSPSAGVVDYQPEFGGAIGGSLYILDQCQSAHSSTCVALPLHLQLRSKNILAAPISMLAISVALEPTFFFGRQRWVGFTLQAAAGYQYSFLRDSKSMTGLIPTTHSYLLQVGIGLVFRLQPIANNMQLYLRIDYNNNSAFSIPIGFRYRF